MSPTHTHPLGSVRPPQCVSLGAPQWAAHPSCDRRRCPPPLVPLRHGSSPPLLQLGYRGVPCESRQTRLETVARSNHRAAVRRSAQCIAQPTTSAKDSLSEGTCACLDWRPPFLPCRLMRRRRADGAFPHARFGAARFRILLYTGPSPGTGRGTGDSGPWEPRWGMTGDDGG